MINHYTANRKVRNDDAYSPGGQIGRRPDRATLAYCQRAREAYQRGAGHRRRRRGQPAPAWPITIIGATRSAVRSCWTARPTCWSMAWASGAIVEIARRLGRRADGARVARSCAAWSIAWEQAKRRPDGRHDCDCPAMKQSRPTSRRSAEMTQDLAQRDESLQRPPAGAISRPRGGGGRIRRRCRSAQAEMDRVYGLPFTRRPHPAYGSERFRPMKWSRIRCRSCAAASAAARSARSRRTKGGSSKAAARSRCWPRSARWRPIPTSTAWSAISAGRRPTCTRCAAPGPRSKPDAAG